MFLRERLSGGGQHQAAVLLVVEQPFGIEPLHHVRHARLGDFQRLGDIDNARVTLRIDQFEDPFEVILDRARGGPGERRGLGRHRAGGYVAAKRPGQDSTMKVSLD